MRLSEAMQMGCIALNPTRGTGRWIIWDKDWNPCGGCILGVTAVAAGYVFGMHSDPYPFFMEAFPLLAKPTPLPDRTGYVRSLQAQIHILFEQDGWSWPKIVEWVQSVEEQVEAEGKTVAALEQGAACQSTK